MALAEFLNTHLLEPQKRRLRAEGYAEGRAKALAEARSALQKAGLNPNDYLPPERGSEDTPASSRC